MARSFDPYRDWLGLNGPRESLNHYRLFGLKLFEANPQTIATASEAVIGRVKRIQTTSHLAEQKELLAELVTARRLLLDADARARYNATLGTTTPDSDEPIPYAVPIADGGAKPSAQPAAPRKAPVTLAPSEPAISEALWKDSDSIPRRLRTAPRADWSGRVIGLASFLFVAALLVAGGLWLMRLDERSAPRAGEPVAPLADAKSPEPRRKPTSAPSTQGESTPRSAQPDTSPARKTPRGDPPAATDRASVPTTDAQPAKTDDDPNQRPAPDRATYRRAMNLARLALASRDLARAGKQLDVADRSAANDGERADVARLRALSVELARFFDTVRAGLQRLQPTDEIRVGEWIAVVVEKGPESLSLFDEGSRRDYTLASMPSKAALFIATVGANENLPEVKMAIGAFQLVDPEGDAQTARRLWSSAAAAGQSIDELVPLLEPGAVAIHREPLPAKDETDAAAPQALARFAATLDAARAPQQQSDLAARLMLASRDCESPLEQYVLLSRAGELAAQATDARVALQISDELARWFEVDALAHKSEVLASLLTHAPSATRAKVIARRALELADAAVDADRAELAKTLADTALAAARKSRDAELVKSTTDRRREITALAKKASKSLSE